MKSATHALYMGALNQETNIHVNPSFATKGDKYICPDCKRNVIFRKGKIKRPHFAHKVENMKCNYYEKPSESAIHKEAKFLMKRILDNKTPIRFKRSCKNCYEYVFFNITNNNYQAIIEHPFIYNDSRKSADVALVDNNGNIIYIFEICYTNATNEKDRPEPWFEINANEFIKYINENSELDCYEIECIRDNDFECEKCTVGGIFNNYKYECNRLLKNINNIIIDVNNINKQIEIINITSQFNIINDIVKECTRLEDKINSILPSMVSLSVSGIRLLIPEIDGNLSDIENTYSILYNQWGIIKNKITDEINSKNNDDIIKYDEMIKDSKHILENHKNKMTEYKTILHKHNMDIQHNNYKINTMKNEMKDNLIKLDIIKNKNKEILEHKIAMLKKNNNMITFNNNLIKDYETETISKDKTDCFHCSLKNFSEHFNCMHKSKCLLNNTDSFICIKCSINSKAIKYNYVKNYTKLACECHKGCKRCIKGQPKDKKIKYEAYFIIKCINCENSYAYDYINPSNIISDDMIDKLYNKWEQNKNNTFKSYDYGNNINEKIIKLQKQNIELNNSIILLEEEIKNINIDDYDINEYEKTKNDYNILNEIINQLNNENDILNNKMDEYEIKKTELSKLIYDELDKQKTINMMKNRCISPPIINNKTENEPCMLLDTSKPSVSNAVCINTSHVTKVQDTQYKKIIPILYRKYGMERNWLQNLPCMLCGRNKYNPYYEKYKFYAICKICYDNSNNFTLADIKKPYTYQNIRHIPQVQSVTKQNKIYNINYDKCDFVD